MGGGSFTHASMSAYSSSLGRSYDSSTGRVSGHSYTAVKIDSLLDPRKFKVRECCNSDEHPNTIPVILALDVTGSMGDACKETAAALGTIITNLYGKYKDVEICVMGIGDLAYDDAPIQMSQFESDVRIAESLDKVYIEFGGGGNKYESYTAAWYMGLYRTKLDCYDKQGRKGIIITMGDEPLNPYLPFEKLNYTAGCTEQANVETDALYDAASKKFDIFHIAVDSPRNCYRRYSDAIAASFGRVLGSRLKVSSVNGLSAAIESCIDDAISSTQCQQPQQASGDGISW